jgi:hypothetical protein
MRATVLFELCDAPFQSWDDFDLIYHMSRQGFPYILYIEPAFVAESKEYLADVLCWMKDNQVDTF